MSRKKQKAQWRQEGGRLVATLPNSPMDSMLHNRRANREAAKAAGTLGHRSGAGTHGGSPELQNRRERRRENQNLKGGRFDGYCDD